MKLYSNALVGLAFRASLFGRAVADGDKEEGACIQAGKRCIKREGECCDGLGCFGFNFFKTCKEPPTCIREWHDCSGGMLDCCDDRVCVNTDNGFVECQTPQTVTDFQTPMMSAVPVHEESGTYKSI
jgi:hypothetical protein